MSIDKFLKILAEKNVLHKHFYHFTDNRNLPSIRTHGLLSMKQLIQRRIAVPVTGGNKWSLEADMRFGMDAYVHLCFTPDHPMEFLAKEEGRIGESTYLRINPNILKIDGVMIAADVSNKAGVSPEPAATMLDKIDLEVIYNRTDWKDPAVKARKKIARKYEILVPSGIPLENIENL